MWVDSDLTYWQFPIFLHNFEYLSFITWIFICPTDLFLLKYEILHPFSLKTNSFNYFYLLMKNYLSITLTNLWTRIKIDWISRPLIANKYFLLCNYSIYIVIYWKKLQLYNANIPAKPYRCPIFPYTYFDLRI